MFLVLITVVTSPLQEKLCPFQPLPPQPSFDHELLDEDIPQVFLQDTKVYDEQLDLLMHLLVLSQIHGSSSIEADTIVVTIQQQLPKF